MSNLILNADDFGYSNGVNYGIIDAYKNGVLTSTTLMVTMSGTMHVVELMKENPELSVGLHLNISLGKPLTDGETLVDENGYFMKPDSLHKEYLYNEDELRAEVRAQYEKYLNIVGKKPSHLDSHLFSTDKVPLMRKIASELALENDIPMRNFDIEAYNHVEFINYRNYNAKPTLDYIVEFFEDIIKNEYVEIMTHPGYVDYSLNNNSSYNVQRTNEVEFLTSDVIKNLIKKNNVNLITYNDVRK